MKADLDWPDVETRGLVRLSLTRSDLTRLLAGLDARHTGTPGIVSVDSDSDLVVVVEASND